MELLIGLSRRIDAVNQSLGRLAGWLVLALTLVTVSQVVARYVFNASSVGMQELEWHLFGAVFLLAGAFTLKEEGHVRVDVFYAGFSNRTKGRVNAIGSILLGMSTCWVIIYIGMGSKQAIINSPVANVEISQSSTAGMFIKYQMAAFLAVFAITMLIQFVSYLFEAVADTRDEPGKREVAPIAH